MISTSIDLAPGIAMWLFCSTSVLAATWVIVHRFLPSPASVSLRLAALLMTFFAVNAVMIQILGLLSLLTRGLFVTVSAVLLGVAVVVGRDRRTWEDLFRLIWRGISLWVLRFPFGLGFVFVVLLIILSIEHSLVGDTDSLSLHGPAVVEWVHTGAIDLESEWNYPQCWEYQFVPQILLIRSDALVMIFRTLTLLALMLLVRELGSRLGLPGITASLVGWTIILTPIVWRSGVLKNDTIFAVGLVAGVVAIERGLRHRGGGFFLAQLSGFMLLGTKPSGFVIAAIILVPAIVIEAVHRSILSSTTHPAGRERLRRFAPILLWLIAITVAIQINPASVQISNTLRTGNPIAPLGIEIGGHVILDGVILKGTSIIESAGNRETWQHFFTGAREALGHDLRVWLILHAAATIWFFVAVLRSHRSGRRDPVDMTALALALAGWFLWLFYLRTPWSCGSRADPFQYIRTGESLRYAVAQICLSATVSVAMLGRWLPTRWLNRLMLIAAPALVATTWFVPLKLSGAARRVSFWVWVTGLAGLAGLATAAIRWLQGRRRTQLALLGVTLMAFTTATALAVEEQRRLRWMPPCAEVWRFIHQHVPSESLIGVEGSGATLHYLLYGPRLDNRLQPLGPRRTAGREPIPDNLDLLYVKTSRRDRPGHVRGIDAYNTAGWTVVAQCREGWAHALLFDRSPPPQ